MTDAAKTSKNQAGQTQLAPRPLSPHLGIYRWQISSTLSILHRMTGVFLSIGSLFLAAWLWMAAYCPEGFAEYNALGLTIIGRLALFAWSAAFFYHLCNGIRHLFWDVGLGFSLPVMARSGTAVVLLAAVFTLLVWAKVYHDMGGF